MIRTTVIILMLAFVSLDSFAQNLTLSQLLQLRMKDLGDAEEYLTTRGWEFLEAKEPDEALGSATFSYNKDEMSNRAQAFITYLYSDYPERKRLSVQVNFKSKYTEYINTLRSLGCKLLLSKVEDGDLIKIYRGATTTFKVSSSTSSNFYNTESAVWRFFILSNDDYDENWGSEQ